MLIVVFCAFCIGLILFIDWYYNKAFNQSLRASEYEGSDRFMKMPK